MLLLRGQGLPLQMTSVLLPTVRVTHQVARKEGR